MRSKNPFPAYLPSSSGTRQMEELHKLMQGIIIFLAVGSVSVPGKKRTQRFWTSPLIYWESWSSGQDRVLIISSARYLQLRREAWLSCRLERAGEEQREMEECGKRHRRVRWFLPWAAAVEALSLAFLPGPSLAARRRGVRWCTISKPEAAKCSKLQQNLKRVRGPSLSCISRKSYLECIQAIAVSQRLVLGKTE